MPSVKKLLKDAATNQERCRLRAMYDEKYFNLFLSSRERENLTREEREYILRKFWALGKVSAFELGEKGSKALAYATYSPFDFNMYNFPIHVNIINEKGVSGIPTKPLKVGEDVVLGWALHSGQPIYSIVANYIDRIVDVEMAIRMNVKAHKIPLAIEVDEDNESDAEELNRDLETDEYKFFIKTGGVDMLKAVSSGAPFILDKLHAYKVSLENELLTFLGINNIAMEKKERLIVDEAEGNDALIKSYAMMIDEGIDGFFEEIYNVFGVKCGLPRKTIEIERGVENETIEE